MMCSNISYDAGQCCYEWLNPAGFPCSDFSLTPQLGLEVHPLIKPNIRDYRGNKKVWDAISREYLVGRTASKGVRHT